MLKNTATSSGTVEKQKTPVDRNKRHSEYLYRHTVTKNSWKGKYARVLCIGRDHLATMEPSSLFRVTHRWAYGGDFVDVIPDGQYPTHILVLFRKNSNVENFSFTAASPQERAELLTDVQRQRALFDRQYSSARGEVFPVSKKRSDEQWESLIFEVAPHGVRYRDAATGQNTGEYLFMYIRGITQVEDLTNSVVLGYGVQVKLHLFVFTNESLKIRFIQLLNEYSVKYIGLSKIHGMRPMTQLQFDGERLGFRRETLEVSTEFAVLKWGLKHSTSPVKRLLGTTSVAFVERDPATYNVVGAYFLKNIFALVRCEDDSQKFIVELKDPQKSKEYTATQRDALLAHILDACRGVGNTQAAVLDAPTNRGKRFCSFSTVASEEIEGGLLNALVAPQKYLSEAPAGTADYLDIIEFFNINVPYNGLQLSENKEGIFAENRERLIFNAANALLQRSAEARQPYEMIQYLAALKRLCSSRPGFSGLAVVPSLVKASGALVTTAIKSNDTATLVAALNYLNVLMCPQHNNYDVEHESINKNRMLSAKSLCEGLLNLLKKHIKEERASLLIQGLLQFFVFALCPPYSETTDANLFFQLIESVVSIVGKSMFSLLNHPCDAIRFLAGQIIRVIIEEGEEEQFKFMQQAALSEGGILMEFNVAAFSKNRLLRDLARRLLAFWTYENPTTQDLLRRMIPLPLLNFLQSSDAPPPDELTMEVSKGVAPMPMGYMEKSGWYKKRFNPKSVAPGAPVAVLPKRTTPVADDTAATSEANQDNLEEELSQNTKLSLRKRQIRVHPSLNWSMLFYQLGRDHRRPDLIWNHATRHELKRAIEVELAAFEAGTESSGEQPVSWNHYEFEVHYTSLDDEPRIGQHYPRLLFENKTPVVDKPRDFFNDLYHRYLLVDDSATKLECLQGMSILYAHYPEEIGYFNDLPFFIHAYSETVDPAYRDRLLLFFAEALKVRPNVKAFLDSNGLDALVADVTLAQLHIDRPHLKVTTNAIELDGARLEDLQKKEKEWYYTKDGAKAGPVSYVELKALYKEEAVVSTSKVWAQGIAGWKKVKDISQLKWGIVAEGSPSILTLTEVTCTILDIFIQICQQYPSRDDWGATMQPPPKVKRFLCSPGILPHIVQLLLTFDGGVCTRVHTLLYHLMEDSPFMGRFFLTGVFFFSLMYSASDVLPMCDLLHLTHLKQSFTFPHTTNETLRHSILSPMLPPAMVCFLQNHGPGEFANVFLGEYETPEAVWGKEMRRHLASKIAYHISDFTARLLGNNSLVYQYCPIAVVEYEQLQNELFCHQYYLRHLCNEQLYPDWEIKEPVSFLLAVLETWRLELNKKPSDLTLDSCLEELEITELKEECISDTFPLVPVRKAYFRLAAQYHPDKNPNGREKFERIQQAYEFLTSRRSKESSEPSPSNIVLLLRSQSILFKRCSDVLKGYKYAGYELLLRLLQTELNDKEAFHKDTVLIVPAVELCYYTVENVPLNADELQEEGGIRLMAQALNRAFEMITPNATDDQVHVALATYAIQTIAVSGQFKDCRKKIKEEPTLSYLACKGAALRDAPKLARACIQSCATQCLDPDMQERIIQHGAVWHLLRFLFQYDSTVADSGIPLQEKHHIQLFSNRAAIYALHALYAVAGICPNKKEYYKTQPNPTIFRLLEKLLTPYIVNLMNTGSPESKILELLNTNVETPYFLWSNSTRTELGELLDTNSALCAAAGPEETNLPSLECASFEYTLHKNELIVGGVFLRVFLEKPNFDIEDPKGLLQSLFDFFVNTPLPNGGPETSPSVPTEEQCRLAATSIHQLVLKYPDDTYDLVALCMDVLVDLLSPQWSPTIHKEVLWTLEGLVKYPSCVSALGNSSVAMAHFVVMLQEDGEEIAELLLKYLTIVFRSVELSRKPQLNKGFYVVLLNYLGSKGEQLKLNAATCLSALLGEKLFGPKIMIQCSKFLPSVICETLKESPSQGTILLESTSENPELIWNANKRKAFASNAAQIAENVVKAAREDPEGVWSFGEADQQLLTPPVSDVCVGGVYLSLYREQSSWAVRKPKQFLADLLEEYITISQDTASSASSKDDREKKTTLVVDCASRLLSSTPSLRDSIAAMGYVDKIARQLNSTDPVLAKNALRWFYEIAQSSVCVEQLCSRDGDPLQALLQYLQSHPLQGQLAAVLEIMEKLVAHAVPSCRIVEKALKNKLPEFLLQWLEKGVSDEAVEGTSPAAVRALIIKILKGLLHTGDAVHTPALEEILSRSEVWQKYKNQSHDLFLTQNRFGGLLSDGSNDTRNQRAPPLSLTTSAAVLQNSEPPPL